MFCSRCGIYRGLLFSAFCLFFSSAIAARDEASIPALPDGFPISLGDTEEVIWVTPNYHFDQSRKSEYFYNRWNPATGELKKLHLPTDLVAERAALSPSGLMFLGNMNVRLATSNPLDTAFLLTPQGKAISATLPLKRTSSRLLALADRSVLVIGGKLAGSEQRTNAVERISLGGERLVVERLPDLPGVVRTSYALVALADGRAMALGGSDYQYIGCTGCLAETFILDPKTKAWIAGPKMLEGRADASATLLQDGSVLVAGGWTPGHGWNEGASRSTEQWDARSNRFTASAPLPNGVALHRTMWAADQQGKQLLLAGGMTGAWEGNDVVMAYDVAGRDWRAVGEDCQGSNQRGDLTAGSLVFRQQTYMWCRNDHGRWKHAALRLPSSSASPLIRDDSGYALQRGAPAFLPSQGDGPALIAGGMASSAKTAAVDAIWPDGRIQALPMLNHPRRDAQIFGLSDGAFLVIGGAGGKSNDRDGELRPLPAEWMSGKSELNRSRWIALDAAFDKSDMLGTMADGSIVAIRSDSAVERIAISVAGGKPDIQRFPLPSMTRKRRSADGVEAGKVLVRGLPDGRIIVAGGAVQLHSIAVLQEDSMQDDAPDKYIGIGEFLPSRRHEIYDPAKKAWQNSVPSIGAGGPVAILDDGRALKIKLSKIIGEQNKDGSWPVEEGFLEISSANGDAWSAFNAKEPPLVKLDNNVRPYVIQGELFLSGESKAINTGGGPSIVQWFNSSTLQWETLWQAAPGDNWRAHVGRIIIRKLANGKRVILPVGGL